MKKVILLFIITFILLFPLSIKAAVCTTEQIERYKKLASNIQTSFDYTENSDGVKFTISFHNVYKDLYLIDYSTFSYLAIYRQTGDSVIKASDYAPGNSYTFYISNNNALCKSRIISKIKVDTPFYNSYHKDPLCEGIETYSLCQKWNNIGKMSYEDFQKSIEDYKSQLEQQKQTQNNAIKDTIWNRIRNFVANYYFYILTGVAIVVITVIYLIQKKKNKLW